MNAVGLCFREMAVPRPLFLSRRRAVTRVARRNPRDRTVGVFSRGEARAPRVTDRSQRRASVGQDAESVAPPRRSHRGISSPGWAGPLRSGSGPPATCSRGPGWTPVAIIRKRWTREEDLGCDFQGGVGEQHARRRLFSSVIRFAPQFGRMHRRAGTNADPRRFGNRGDK